MPVRPLRNLIPLLALAAFQASAEPSAGELAGPAPAGRLVAAQPYRLAVPVSWPTASGPREFAAGYLVVLEADGWLSRPRQVSEPGLFADDAPASRINHGSLGSHVVAVVPADGALSDILLWWAPPNPDPARAGDLAVELGRARAAGLVPFTEEEIVAAFAVGGDTVEAERHEDLWPRLLELCERYDPEWTEERFGEDER